MLNKGLGALVIALALSGAANAADWRNGAVEVAANRYVVTTEVYGRPSQLGLLLYPTQREAPAPVSAVMDCSTEPLAGQKDVSQPFACYAHTPWPASGTAEAFEDGQRHSFGGQ